MRSGSTDARRGVSKACCRNGVTKIHMSKQRRDHIQNDGVVQDASRGTTDGIHVGAIARIRLSVDCVCHNFNKYSNGAHP